MIEKLKRYYKNHLVIDKQVVNQEQYCWYIEENGATIGIEKNVLTEQERNLLSVFMQPVNNGDRQLTEQQQSWRKVMDGKGEAAPFLPVRFVYFSFNEKIEDESGVEEALEGMLPYPFVLLWQGSKEGVIIEHYSENEVAFYEPIIDTFATDFFVTMKLLIGNVHHTLESIQKSLEIENQCRTFVEGMEMETKIHTMASIMPRILLKNISKEEKRQFMENILGNVLNEPDLLKTIKIFLQCNQNVTLAAKKQYMHRNSVQYRVDKFIEKTEIDIKTFEGAALVYLAFLCQTEILFTVHK